MGRLLTIELILKFNIANDYLLNWKKAASCKPKQSDAVDANASVRLLNSPKLLETLKRFEQGMRQSIAILNMGEKTEEAIVVDILNVLSSYIGVEAASNPKHERASDWETKCKKCVTFAFILARFLDFDWPVFRISRKTNYKFY